MGPRRTARTQVLRSVLLYELNEVPWSIIDHYVALKPSSTLSGVLNKAATFTTIDEDPVSLQPWRTWPTFHRSMYTPDHGSRDLGQDPSTFAGEAMWDTASDAGKRVGLFGPMQSWPPRHFPGGFHVPDTFARSPATHPASLSRFQEFNLSMTQENSFSSDQNLGARQLVGAGVDMVTKGLTPRSVIDIASHLVRERRDARHRGARSMMQVIPSFDLFWRLHRRTRPDLSIFFTNHVAGMMHRYWGDGIEGYDDAGYTPDKEVFGTFVVAAMDLFDGHLSRMVAYAENHPSTVVVVASSMGQAAIPYRKVQTTYLLSNPQKLLDALGLRGSEGLAMYPRTSFEFATEEEAGTAVPALQSVQSELGPMFYDFGVAGRTLSVGINVPDEMTSLPTSLHYLRPSGEVAPAPLDELGFEIRDRLGGGNTAYHIPEGVFFAHGEGVESDATRCEVSVLDAAPSLLRLLGVEPAPTMQGKPSMFA